jgi:hypothetical protein
MTVTQEGSRGGDKPVSRRITRLDPPDGSILNRIAADSEQSTDGTPVVAATHMYL